MMTAWARRQYIIGISVVSVCIFLYAVLYVDVVKSISQANNQIRHNEVQLNETRVRKVMFVCYMRGGSTVGAQMFNQDPHAMMWYEPMASFFMSQYGTRPASKPHHLMYTADWTPIHYSTEETSSMGDFVRQLFDCEFDSLPVHTLLHPFVHVTTTLDTMHACVRSAVGRDALRRQCAPKYGLCWLEKSLDAHKRNHCHRIHIKAAKVFQANPRIDSDNFERMLLRYVNESLNINAPMKEYVDLARSLYCVYNVSRHTGHCRRQGQAHCNESTLRVGKFLRVRLREVKAIMADNPDVFVVHFVRDPRATAASRVNTAGLMVDAIKRDVSFEAHVLCEQMRDDLYQGSLIETQFPDAFHRLRYEDFVQDPVTSMKTLYDMIGQTEAPLAIWHNFTEMSFSASKDGSAFGTLRSNASASVDKWKSEISLEDLRSIEQSCADVLRDLGYPFIV